VGRRPFMPDSTLNRRSGALLRAEANRSSYPQKTAESLIISIPFASPKTDVSSTSRSISPIKDPSGNVVGASKIARDITGRKLAEEALKEAQKVAEAANIQKERLLESERAARSEAERAGRMKDEFLATLSHELRTPLNAVLGWANALLADHPRAGQLTEGLETIERNARVQAQLINDLLDMSRIILGKVRLDVQRLDLPTIVAASIDTVRAAALAKGVRLQIVIDPLDAPVSGDPNRLQQVFWNLLNNSIKFTPKEGRIQVLLERVDSQVEVSIIDTGEGISLSSCRTYSNGLNRQMRPRLGAMEVLD
jgi:signal transduction histidine kinase